MARYSDFAAFAVQHPDIAAMITRDKDKNPFLAGVFEGFKRRVNVTPKLMTTLKANLNAVSVFANGDDVRVDVRITARFGADTVSVKGKGWKGRLVVGSRDAEVCEDRLCALASSEELGAKFAGRVIWCKNNFPIIQGSITSLFTAEESDEIDEADVEEDFDEVFGTEEPAEPELQRDESELQEHLPDFKDWSSSKAFG